MATSSTLKAQRAASQARIAEAQAEARRVRAAGVCPFCGSPVKDNSALAGWVQCVAYATPSFRAAEYRSLPSCSWQGFTQ
jgi:hypothetical protein